MGNDFDLAVKCGLVRRFGPSADETAAMKPWRRALVTALPRRHRWRLSSLASQIRKFDQDLA